MAGPVLAAGAGILGAAGVMLSRPTDGGLILCPFKAITGWDCPFCGATRATAAVLHGDVVAALDHNAYHVVVLLPLLALAWLTWAAAAWAGRPFPELPNRWWQVLLGTLVAWWAFRLAVPWFHSELAG